MNAEEMEHVNDVMRLVGDHMQAAWDDPAIRSVLISSYTKLKQSNHNTKIWFTLLDENEAGVMAAFAASRLVALIVANGS